jgi:hypothetical protein
LIAGFNPALIDSVCARLMGFDPGRIPLVCHALEQACFLPMGASQKARIIADDPRFQQVLNWRGKDSLAFCPPRGWIGHIESGN